MALYIKLFFSEPLNFPGNFANTDVNFLNWKLRKITEEEEKKQNKKNYVEQTKIVWQLLFFFLTLRVIFLGSQKAWFWHQQEVTYQREAVYARMHRHMHSLCFLSLKPKT